MSALRESGVAVPDDVAIAGFDDISKSRFTSPPLSTVRVNTALLGERAVELLLRARRSPNPGIKQHELLPTTLTIRNSCGARPARRGDPVRWRRASIVPTTAE